MSITDSTQLEGHINIGLVAEFDGAKATARADDTGTVALSVGTLCVVLTATDAANLAASLATAAATAIVNKTLRVVSE